jgi:hypothetical protein
MLFWCFDDLTLLPRELFAIVHYLRESSARGMSIASVIDTSYLLRAYVLDILADILRIALFLMAAGWFYRCGPRIRRFFGAGVE